MNKNLKEFLKAKQAVRGLRFTEKQAEELKQLIELATMPEKVPS